VIFVAVDRVSFKATLGERFRKALDAVLSTAEDKYFAQTLFD
jgi:hypothetical protein